MLVDDHAAVRAGFRSVSPGFKVGPNRELQYSLNASPVMARFKHHGAVS
jgi:hypothetical protein